jgi:hypothetical protein
MSLALAIKVAYEPQRSLAFGSIASTYTIVGSLFTHPIRILVLQNATDVAVSFSLDGANTLITLQAGVSITFNFCANKTSDEGLMAPIHFGVYAKQTGAGSGSVYASAIYGTENT